MREATRLDPGFKKVSSLLVVALGIRLSTAIGKTFLKATNLVKLPFFPDLPFSDHCLPKPRHASDKIGQKVGLALSILPLLPNLGLENDREVGSVEGDGLSWTLSQLECSQFRYLPTC